MEFVKTCTKCGRELTIDNFYKSPNGKYGVYSVCKKCVSEIHKKYYSKDLEKRRVMNKVYNQRRDERLRQAKINKEMIETLKVSEILGGYRIYVLNHCKEGEVKYTCVKVSTAEVYRTNDKEEFISYLRENL